MKGAAILGALLCGGVILAVSPAQVAAQNPVEIKATSPEKPPQLRIEEPGPATRDATRPREAGFYPGTEVRVRHEPAFIDPFVGETENGTKYGLSGWTSPATPVGSIVPQGEYQTSGWPALGFSVVWYSAPLGPRRVSDPR
ncbi:MAG TPA: hypothetical protein VEH80_05170 [Candidatus Bathyarchaeia archaeon]|nr:hypothetical protein [Candidatus Bathyarchaeia archaeon]